LAIPFPLILLVLLLGLGAMPALEISQLRRRRRLQQRRGQRIGACVALTGAALALITSCAMTWWETSNDRVDPPERSVGQFGGDPWVTFTIAAIFVAGLLRLQMVLRRVLWGATTAQVVTWILFIVGIFVANPQIGGTDVRGDLEIGYFVGLAAAGLVALAGVVDWPLWSQRSPNRERG